MSGKNRTQKIAERVVADCCNTATGNDVNRAHVLVHSYLTAWPEANDLSQDGRARLVDQVSAEVAAATK